MRQQIKTAEKKDNLAERVVRTIFFCFTIFMSTLTLGRVASLSRHHSWRKDIRIKNVFPPACGEWAEDKGCTRIVMESDGCVAATPFAAISTLYDASFLSVNEAI